MTGCAWAGVWTGAKTGDIIGAVTLVAAPIAPLSPKLIVMEKAGSGPPARASAAVRLAATAEESEREKVDSAEALILPFMLRRESLSGETMSVRESTTGEPAMALAALAADPGA